MPTLSVSRRPSSTSTQSRLITALLCLSLTSFIAFDYVIDLVSCVHPLDDCQQTSLVAAGKTRSSVGISHASHRHLKANVSVTSVSVRTQQTRSPRYPSTHAAYSHIPLASSGMNHPPPTV